jgi:hypothetical protein
VRHISLRHALATLAYRAAKTIREAPADFHSFRPGPNSRSAGEIVAHLGDLIEWAISQARGQETWRAVRPRSWAVDADRFFSALTRFDEYLASTAPLSVPPERLFQGAIADALTHVGQLAMMRRLADAPVKGENYSVAHIAEGQTAAEQPTPVREFG